MHPIHELRLEKVRLSGEGFVVELAERSDVVEYPESAAVRGDCEVIVFHDDVAHRGRGQIQAQGLPVVSVVKGDIYSALGGGEEQALTLGVFTDGIDIFIGGNAGDDFRPGFAAVASAKDVRAQVVEAQRIDGGVGGVGIGVAGFDNGNLLPSGQSGRCDVVPVSSAVCGEPDESVVGAGPDAVDVEW